MTIIAESPHCPSTAPVPEHAPRWQDARDQMIHACALQEFIIANAVFLPKTIGVSERYSLAHGGGFPAEETDLDVYLHRNPAAVLEYRGLLGGELKYTVDAATATAPERVLHELRGSMFGCRFRVWTLVDVELPSVMREYIAEGHDPDMSHWTVGDYARFVAKHPRMVTS